MKPIAKKKKKKYTRVQGTHSPLFKKDAHFLTCNSASPKTKHFFAPFFCSVVNKNLEPSIIKRPHQSSHTLFGGYKPFCSEFRGFNKRNITIF
jgi:hypothetical protein